MQGPRQRSWCFTYFFEDESTFPQALPDGSAYLTYGYEVCPDTKRPHLQGYVHWSTPVRLTTCRKFLEANWTPCSGSPEQNITYCQKDGDYVEYGHRPQGQGGRSDLLSLKRAIDEGSSVPKLWEDHFSTMMRYNRGAAIYKKLKATARSRKTFCLFICGPPGLQKTTLANIIAKSYSPNSVYTVPDSKGSGLYFDGYDGQQCVILDEMDGVRMKPTLFNGLADAFEYSVPVHGAGNVNWNPTLLIVISNYAPKYWWRKRTADQLLQTTRRIDWTIKRIRPLKVREPMLILSRFPPLPGPIMSFNL